ncbi:MAG TPA: hypothetical protein VFE65_10140 [Pseudonocardia sp.]|nr:hypothetical protein [Pseudonocardia sp.]
MPRRHRDRAGRDSRPALGGAVGWARTESGADGDWMVRTVPGSNAQKTYRCPGCDQQIPPGVGHIVAWPAGVAELSMPLGADGRRHWHTACWSARDRRRPGRRR